MNPYKFENLMVQLLSVMGYKGDEGQALVTNQMIMELMELLIKTH